MGCFKEMRAWFLVVGPIVIASLDKQTDFSTNTIDRIALINATLAIHLCGMI
jgi:hypothetical protein